MKWWVTGLIVALGVVPASAQVGDALTNGIVIIRGCVVAGEADTYILNDLTEVKRNGEVERPRNLARPVIYWLNDAQALKPHVGRRVEISGRITGVEQREAEIRRGPRNDGSLVVEIEGPGRDVRTTLSAVEGAVGTSGTTQPSDVATAVIKVAVGHLRPLGGYCR